MFEKIKFNKKFSLIKSYINDSDLIKNILENSKISKYYNNNYDKLDSFIRNLKLIYTSEQISEILKEMLQFFSGYKLDQAMESLNSYIDYTNKYNKGNLDILKQISFDEIKNTPYYLIQGNVLNLCFKKYYKEKIIVRGRDFLEIFMFLSDINIKEKIYMILKNNNLDFLAFIINELSNESVYIENIDEIFKTEISDKIYEPKTKEKLGAKNFSKLLVGYFSNTWSYWDKKIINELLEIENYELLKDLLQVVKKERLTNHVKLENLNVNFDNLSTFSKSSIIYAYLDIKERIYFDYYENLKHCVSNDIIEDFYNKYKETIDLFNSIRDKNFSELSKQEQNKIYQYIKELTVSDKKILIEEIKKINLELQYIYKKLYADTYKKSNIILDKATSVCVKDIHLKEETIAAMPKFEDEFESTIEERKKSVLNQIEKKYQKHGIKEYDNVLVYNLEKNEPFEFLITVMARGAREIGTNMYGRPKHRVTIDNPQLFCEDLSGGSEIISCSMINDKCIQTFLGDRADIMYVFSDIEKEDILTISPVDASLSPKIEEQNDLFKNIEPVDPKQFMRETKYKNKYNSYSYNEIAIRRKKIMGEKQMPSAILCFDEINSDSIIHAKFFNVPIIVIKTKTYSYLKDYTDINKSVNKIL